MENEEKEQTPENAPIDEPIEEVFVGENENPVKPKRTKKEIRNLIIIGSIYGALVALTIIVLVIGLNSSSSSTIPSTHLAGTSAGYYNKDKNLISSFSTDDVSLENKDGFYSISSIAGKEGAAYLVIPSSYDGTKIMHTSDLAEGTNLFGNDQYGDAIEEIYFPNIYWTIGTYSLSEMDSLTHVSLAGASSGNLTISQGAFQNCPSLLTVELPKNLVSLGEGAFANCASLETIDFKGTVSSFKAIPNYEKAFSGNVTIKCSDGEIQVDSSYNE